MPKLILPITFILLLLTGCWSSEELDDTALAHGIGFDKAGGKLRISVEIIRPSDQATNTGESQSSGQHIILEEDVDTFLTGVRALIRTAKRRVHFEHARVWIIGANLAKDDFISQLDIVRRDQMFRLGSLIFVTKGSPADILNTPTLYENLTSLELASTLEETRFTTGFVTVNMFEFFGMMEGPLPNAYLPIITKNTQEKQETTAMEGTAVIKDGKMVGELSINETIGLNWLLNKVKGGSITIEFTKQRKGALRIKRASTKITPILKDKQLQAQVQINILTDFVDNSEDHIVNEAWINELKRKVSRKVEADVCLALKKLQKELKTDISGIGLATYRKYPHKWEELYPQWNEIFSAAEVTVDVEIEIIHTGKINQNLKRNRKKPTNNPFRFWLKNA